MDGLIAAAGIQQEVPALEYSARDANTMFEVSLAAREDDLGADEVSAGQHHRCLHDSAGGGEGNDTVGKWR